MESLSWRLRLHGKVTESSEFYLDIYHNNNQNPYSDLDPISDPDQDPNPNPNPDHNPDPNPDSNPDPNPDPNPDLNPDPKPDSSPDPNADPNTLLNWNRTSFFAQFLLIFVDF